MSGILDLFYPRRCLGCGRIGRYFCQKCRLHIPKMEKLICPVCLKSSFDGLTHLNCRSNFCPDGLFVSTYYRGIMKKALKMLKYRLVRDLAPEIAGLFLESCPSYLLRLNLLIPVPLYPGRQRERGFNQSEILVREMAGRLKIKQTSNNLIRIRSTQPQFGLEKKTRLSNVKNAFSLKTPQTIKGKQIGLIDDVTTTGATLRECAKVLKIGGAVKVWGLVIAHG
ncbi:MAG: phosphoribosyltransferase [Candidatus Gottesmanbacteria bacterium GW2011_GWA2_43_14]|uniref:Phosphoribosyltransferase n=1 Tax=Candidatus Gottesmanbacteria bacterium GW2011_GWA2_43_14 TaxID=1618443 RepID=A0A0G1DCV1_9BACT|nr:MAG: phosphoribosyltransferase [Candidatus Gottesmanbacteria bacterium GW2011_GWA2_43_14]